MIPEIKRILYPTDMSESASNAFLYAASIAFRVGGLITVLHVLDEGSPNTKLVLDAILGTDGGDADMVVMGSRGHGILKETLLGALRTGS